MIIPKEIKVNKTKYDIRWFKQIIRGKQVVRGVVEYDLNKITMAKTDGTNKYSKQEKEETFWHELTHAILKDMNHSLYDNEKFVTQFSQRLNDAIRSAKF
jgi:hypothetical protein